MADQKDKKKNEMSESPSKDLSDTCSFVDPCCRVDPCGCYVDPCGCYVSACCC